MHVSADGRLMIEEFEGCRLTAYSDAVGVVTIGYGCTGGGIYEGMTITQAEADQMLSARLANEFEPGVLRAIGDTPTTQAEFDALVSLAFNIGLAHFRASSVCRLHCQGDYAAAADAFLMWNKGRVNGVLVVLSGLDRRRREERELYLSGDAEGDAPTPAMLRGIEAWRKLPAPTQPAPQPSAPASGGVAGLWRRLFG